MNCVTSSRPSPAAAEIDDGARGHLSSVLGNCGLSDYGGYDDDRCRSSVTVVVVVYRPTVRSLGDHLSNAAADLTVSPKCQRDAWIASD